MSGRVLILGASSGIARALAVELARAGHGLVLAGRRPEQLAPLAADLKIRFGVEAETAAFDALDPAGHDAFVAGVAAGGLGGAVLAFGFMGEEEESWRSWAATRLVLESNFNGAVSVLLPLARHFEQAGEGFLAAISSVAGDRGRKKNVTYGAAKAGLTAYMEGLMQRLAGTRVKVVVVKPGFVDTRMTWPLGRLPLVVPPERAARDVMRALRRGSGVVYTPWPWRWIMAAIRALPAALFKRLEF